MANQSVSLKGEKRLISGVTSEMITGKRGQGRLNIMLNCNNGRRQASTPLPLSTPDRTITRTIAMARVAFRVGNLVGLRDVSLSRLNGQPARSPTDASPCPSRDTTHGSGPVWVAAAFTVEDFHLLLFAGLPAHCQDSLIRMSRCT